MHYKNGRKAKVGDKVVMPHCHKHNPQTGKFEYHPIVGTITEIHPGATSCNANVLPVTTPLPTYCATLSDCVHVDDVDTTKAISDSAEDIVTAQAPGTPDPTPSAS